MKFAPLAFMASATVVAAIVIFLVLELDLGTYFRGDDAIVHIRNPEPASDGVLWSETSTTELYEKWFGSQLHAMGEPSLWQLSKDDAGARVYRMLVLPSFSPATGARLVIQADGSAKIHVTTLNGAGGYAPGRVEERKVLDLESKQVRELDMLFERGGFWTDRIGISQRTDRPEIRCEDGIQYVIEVVSLGNYKLVTRHMCSMENEIRDILNAFAAMSGTQPPIEIPW